MTTLVDYLVESIDSKPAKIKKTGKGYRFTIGGVQYKAGHHKPVLSIGYPDVIEKKIDEGAQVLEFSFENDKSGIDLTGEHQAAKVLSTLVSILIKEAKALKPDQILYFSSFDDLKSTGTGIAESSFARMRIYEKLLKREIKKMRGLTYTIDKDDIGGLREFFIYRE